MGLDFFSKMPRIDGLMALSVRWIQPIQQQGRRFPSFSSVTVRLIWSFLVASCLTEMFQQIHSLRASGVSPCHFSKAALSDTKALRRSAGISCTVPPSISSLVINISYPNWYQLGIWYDVVKKGYK